MTDKGKNPGTDKSGATGASSWSLWCWILLVVWVLFMTYDQDQLSTVWRGYVAVLIGAAVLGTFLGMKERFQVSPLEVVAAVMVFATMGWAFLAGSFQSWRQFGWDMAVLVGSTLVVNGVLRRLDRRSPAWWDAQQSNREYIQTVLSVLCAWLGISVFSVVVTRPLPVDPQRFAGIVPAVSLVPEEAAQWQELRIGLALSGGGYRAAVLHSGTLHALETLGVRLQQLSTVSGGSIIGAYYAIGGDPLAFKDAVAAGKFDLKRELLLLHNALRLSFPMQIPGLGVRLFPWYDYSRRDVQAVLLDKLLLDSRQHTAPASPLAPSLVINTTDLNYGLIVGFLHDGIVIQGDRDDLSIYRGEAYLPTTQFSLAERAALSGAFPLAFPGADFQVRVLPAAASGTGQRSLLLVDGGVADNTGLQTLVAMHTLACETSNCNEQYSASNEWHSDVMLVSDGGAIFGVEPELGSIASVSRAIDVSGARSGQRFGQLSGMPTVFFSAQTAYLNPSMLFRMFNGEPVSPEKELQITFDPLDGYPKAVLEAIFALLPDESYPAIAPAMDNFSTILSNAQSINRQTWSRELPRAVVNGDCEMVQTAQNLPGLCAAVELRRSLLTELARLLIVFRATPTLEDKPDAAQVEDLYRLGQLLVYLKWPELREAMTVGISRSGIGAQ